MIKAKDIISFIDEEAPPHLAESWDNVGLLVGSKEKEISRVLLTLDITEKVVDEAIAKKIDMIIAHHPLIFKGIKRVTEDSVQSKLVYRLIRNDINVFAAHTNLDVAPNSINLKLAELLGLNNIVNLSDYRSEKLYKLIVYTPDGDAEKVRNAICEAGGGWIGKYKDCTFQTNGTGTFTPMEGTNPYIGEKCKLAKVDEIKLETVVPEAILKNVIDKMLEVHPYEEVAYDLISLENKGYEYGLGKAGILNEEIDFSEFIKSTKKNLSLDSLRYTNNPPDKVKKVAIFCGSFDEGYIGYVKRQKADVLITGDLKHHLAIDLMENGVCAIDCGHYGTEKIVIDMFAEMLYKKFKEVEFVKSERCVNPLITI